MDVPFETRVNDTVIFNFMQHIAGSELTARVLPREQWPESLQQIQTHMQVGDVDSDFGVTTKLDNPIPLLEEPITLFALVTPAAQYKDLEAYTHELEGEVVNMGDIPTLRAFGDTEIKFALQDGMYYDLLSRGFYRGEKIFAGGGRLSTAKGDVPCNMTFDGMRMLVLDELGISPSEATGLRAKITPMTAWSKGGRFIIAGFEFDVPKEGGFAFGAMAYHTGAVDFYHGKTRAEVREALGFPAEPAHPK